MGRRIITHQHAESKNNAAAEMMLAYNAPTFTTPGKSPAAIPAQTTADDYMTRLVKYIPADIIAVYLFINGIISSQAAPNVILRWVVFALLLVLTPIYIWRVTNDRTLPPAWDQMIVAFFSFAIWVFAIGGPFTTLVWYSPLYGSILVALYTLVIPMIRK